MKKKVLLWVDLTLGRKEKRPIVYFEDFFTIRRNLLRTGLEDFDSRPDALCFDYDYPDRAGLELLQKTKQAHPSIPILMLTVQHSEELAVWAFRARVWDYFVKPVQYEDVARCARSLVSIGNQESRPPVRTTPPLPAENDIVRANNSHSELTPALEYVKSHLGQKITLKQVSARCGMSPYKFSRAFHRAFGETFQNFLLRFRISKACEMLINPHTRISDVAFLTGFHDASYFSKVFKRFHGVPPTHWQQSQLQEHQAPTLETSLLQTLTLSAEKIES